MGIREGEEEGGGGGDGGGERKRRRRQVAGDAVFCHTALFCSGLAAGVCAYEMGVGIKRGLRPHSGGRGEREK